MWLPHHPDAVVTSRKEDDDQDGALVTSTKDLHKDVLLYASDDNYKKDDALVTSEKEKINKKRISVPTIVAGENDSVIDRATVVGTIVDDNVMKRGVIIYASGEGCVHLYAPEDKGIVRLFEPSDNGDAWVYTSGDEGDVQVYAPERNDNND